MPNLQHRLYTVSENRHNIFFAVTWANHCPIIIILAQINIIYKLDSQKLVLVYFPGSPYSCAGTTWQNTETRKSCFWLKCCINALPDFNQSLIDSLRTQPLKTVLEKFSLNYMRIIFNSMTRTFSQWTYRTTYRQTDCMLSCPTKERIRRRRRRENLLAQAEASMPASEALKIHYLKMQDLKMHDMKLQDLNMQMHAHFLCC